MTHIKAFSISSSILILNLITTLYLFTSAHAAWFDIKNQCPYIVWAAAVPAGGGRQLNPGQSWGLYVPPGTGRARIWARTGCSFDGSGRGRCQTGDCGGLLQCKDYGSPPNTLAEFALNQGQNNLDYYDISVAAGFNVPMEFSPTSNHGCTRAITCSGNINEQCPKELRTEGGCNDPCTVFRSDKYCCNSGNECGPTNYSEFFKSKCPDAFTYPKDDKTSIFTSNGGTNYTVVFCP